MKWSHSASNEFDYHYFFFNILINELTVGFGLKYSLILQFKRITSRLISILYFVHHFRSTSQLKILIEKKLSKLNVIYFLSKKGITRVYFYIFCNWQVRAIFNNTWRHWSLAYIYTGNYFLHRIIHWNWGNVMF